MSFDLIFTFFTNMLFKLFELLNSISFSYNGISIYYGWLLISLLVISFVISVFWKGARA